MKSHASFIAAFTVIAIILLVQGSLWSGNLLEHRVSVIIAESG